MRRKLFGYVSVITVAIFGAQIFTSTENTHASSHIASTGQENVCQHEDKSDSVIEKASAEEAVFDYYISGCGGFY